MVSEGEATIEVRGRPSRCPYCHDDCDAEQANVVCNDCLARHHAACWAEAGNACGGCRSTRAAGGGAPPAAAPVSATQRREAPRSLKEEQLLADFDPRAVARLRGELRSGETLIWAGAPIPWAFAREGLPIALFGLVFGGFAAFWIVAAAFITSAGPGRAGIGSCFPLFGLPFLAVGLGLVASPLFGYLRARGTLYAITDRRVLLFEGGTWGGLTIRTYRGEDLGALRRVERSDGSGDLVIEEGARVGPAGVAARRCALQAVPRVREVEALLRRTLLEG